MKKYAFIFLIIIQGIVSFGQQTSLSSDLVSFPVSPEAGRLSVYGNIPVNLFYGQLDKTTNLFNGKVGDYNLSLNLSYNYSGNRLEETPSIVGLGWQLVTGGVITREVRGLPDEHPRGYYGNGGSLRDNILAGYFNNGVISEFYATKIMEGEYDTEVDKYNLSVNGINFSFKIGLDGTAVFLSKHNYKLEIVRNSTNNLDIVKFILIDTNSNQYIFEEKETNEPLYRDDNIFNDSFQRYTSSWQLSKIITNNESSIVYNYQSDDFESYNFYATGKSGHMATTDLNSIPPLYDEGVSKDLIKRKILKSIESSFFKIDFSIVTINNQEVYDKIIIKDSKNTIVDQYDFNYGNNRNLLKRINKNGKLFFEYEYMQEYNFHAPFINSINNMPWGQDNWGFANAKSNAYGITIPYTIYNSDRNPDFNVMALGALTKIKYPTGGETQIFYEQNTIKGNKLSNAEIILDTRIHLKFKSDNVANAPFTKEMYFTKTFDTNVLATLQHTLRSISHGHIELTIEKIPVACTNNQLGGISDQYYIGVQNSRNITNEPIPLSCPNLYTTLDDNYSTTSFVESKDSGGKFIIPAGTYKFKFKTLHNNYKDVSGEVILDFYDSSNPEVNQKTGGIRVNKIVDSDMNGKEVVRYFDYNDPFSTAVEFTSLINTLNYKVEDINNNGYYIVDSSRLTTEYFSKSYNPILKRGTPVYYEKVKEYPVVVEEIIRPLKFLCNNCGGDFYNYDDSKIYLPLTQNYGIKKTTYPQGYKLTEFENPKSGASTIYPFSPKGDDLSLGQVKNSQILSKTQSDLTHKKLLEESNLYNYNFISPSLNYPKSLKIGYKIRRTGNYNIYNNSVNVNNYFKFEVYKEYDIESTTKSKKTIEYLNNLPVEKNVAFEYDSYNQLNKVTSTDNNNILINEMFHPYDFTDSVSLDMKDKNNITPVVSILNKKNSEIVNSFKYQFIPTSNNCFKPKYLFKSKGANNFEKIISYDSYDDKGNPTQYTLENGIPVTIIWGYNKTQPIAKIENTTYASIQSQVVNLQRFSNTGTEEDLLAALTSLRTSLPKAMVTTYTHKPLVGVSTITDPKGNKIIYEYDAFNRLKNVKDKDGNILSQNEYHYKN